MKKNIKSSAVSWDNVWKSYNRRRYVYQLALEQKRIRWQKINSGILNKFGSFTRLNCIEIGAGSGIYSMLFASRGAQVTLLDYSKNALDLSRHIFKDYGINEQQVRFLEMDALKIDRSLFNKYDVSMSFGVAEHFKKEDRKRIVENHLRVLKNGGVAFICVSNKWCLPRVLYGYLVGFRKRNSVESYPYSRNELLKILIPFGINKTDFIYYSLWRHCSPIEILFRKQARLKPISELKTEKPVFWDKIFPSGLTLVAWVD